MVMKDGFDKNTRMEMHENAEESTYSDHSENSGSENLDCDLPENQDLPDNQEEQPAPSRASNRTIEIENFSPLRPNMVSTPEIQNNAETLERTRVDILNTLNAVQGLCDETMREVNTLKTRWNEVELETNTLKVGFE